MLPKKIKLKKKSKVAALVEAERAKANALFDSIGEGAITTNETGRIVRVNQIALDLLGYETKDVIGRWFPDVILAEDENGNPVSNIDRPISKALLEGRPVNAKTIYRRKDGTRVPVFINVSPILHDRFPIGAIQVFRDITQENAIERAKDEFLSLASHQLRTPATAVKQFLGLVVEGYAKDKKEADTFLKNAYDSNEEQLQIIDDILNVAKIDAGKLSLNAEQIDLHELLAHAVAELEGQAKQNGHTLKLKQPKGAVPYTGDKLKLTMSVQNLISNAIKYSPNESPINITLTTKSDHILISVQDHGIGISKSDQAKLFTRFGRLQTELTAKVQGTGLGLYIINEFIKMHHGKISVESTPGRGTTFIIELPKEK